MNNPATRELLEIVFHTRSVPRLYEENKLDFSDSPEQFYAVALRHDRQHQQPQAPHTYWKILRAPVQQHVPQQEIQRTGLSVEVPSSTNIDTLKHRSCSATDHDRVQ
jgi:hypothetical protein